MELCDGDLSDVPKVVPKAGLTEKLSVWREVRQRRRGMTASSGDMI